MHLDNKRLAKNTIFLYARMLLVMLIGFYTTRVVLDVLGISDYGVYNIVAGFIALFAILNNSLSIGINRFYNYAIGKKDENQIKCVYNVSIRIQCILAFFLVILLEIIGLWYINNKMVIAPDRIEAANYLFQFSIASLTSVIIQVPYSAVVIANERMDFYALVSIVDSLCKLGIVILLQFVSTDKLILYGALLLVISVIDFLLYFVYCKIHFSYLKLTKYSDKSVFNSLLIFSGWSILDPFSYIVRDQGSNMVLNLFFGTIVNAAYGVASSVSNAVISFASNLFVAFQPQIIQSYSAGDYNRTKSLMFVMSKVNFFLQVIIAVPLIFEMNAILSLWLKDVPPFAVVFASLIVIINGINVLNAPISILMTATGELRLIKTVSLIIITSVVPIGYMLFKVGMPPYYIYIAMLGITIINQISCVLIMCSKFPSIRPIEYIRVIALPSVILSVVAVIVPLLLITMMEPSFIRILAMFLTSSLITSITAYYFFFGDSERTVLKSIAKKIQSKLK